VLFLSGYEFTEGSQFASSQDVGTWNQAVVVSSQSIVNWQLTKKTHHQIPDSGYFCTHRRFEPTLYTSVLNNLRLEYSWPLLPGDEEKGRFKPL